MPNIADTMMPELSLHVLDIAENSIRAGASLITIEISVDPPFDTLAITIEDNGCGMTREQADQVTDPFYTTRTARRIGLGIPFFQYAAESTGGSLQIESSPGTGTAVKAEFGLSHIDRMPLGDISATIHTLILYHPDIDFIYNYRYHQASYALDTRQLRQILGDISFKNHEISNYIKEYLTDNKLEADGGAVL